jgi:hypothetical protein
MFQYFLVIYSKCATPMPDNVGDLGQVHEESTLQFLLSSFTESTGKKGERTRKVHDAAS